MEFKDPLFFLLLVPLLPAALYGFYRRRGRAALPFSTVRSLKSVPGSARMKIRRFLPVLSCGAVVLLVTALARPRTGRASVEVSTRGVAVMVVLDRSGSMAERMGDGGRSKMEESKDVLKRFVLGDEELGLPGRRGDMIGLVTFASFPTAMCPLTLCHNALVTRTEEIDPITPEKYGRDLARAYSRTAIGDALKLAVARLVTAGERLGKGRYTIKSKVIILITDGRNNAGSPPEEAAALARKHGVKIYAVGIGARSRVARTDIFGDTFFLPLFGEGADMETLKKIASATGGFARQATDRRSLVDICREIDRAEKSTFRSRRYVLYTERYRPFLRWGIALYLAYVVLNATLLGRRP